jgi:zinc transport system substrate-binding protein
MKNIILITLSIVAIIAAVIAFTSQGEIDSQAPDIAATIHPLYDITKQVAGDELTVTRILPPGASPHTFEPAPKDLRNLSDIQRVYAIGQKLDDWASELVDSEELVLTVDEGINLRAYEEHDMHEHDTDADHHHDEHHEDKHEHEDAHNDHEDTDHNDHEHGEFDPHYWLSTENAAIIANTIAQDLGELYPESAAVFEQNAAAFTRELQTVKTDLEAELAELSNRNIITLHEAWYYFAEDFNLNLAASFEPAPGREPTAADIAELTDAVDDAGVKTIYTEVQLGDLPLKTFAEDQGLTVAELDPLGGTEGRESYIDLITYNANIIKANQ